MYGHMLGLTSPVGLYTLRLDLDVTHGNPAQVQHHPFRHLGRRPARQLFDLIFEILDRG